MIHAEYSQYLMVVLMFFGAALYASVGHAGASAYLSIMALFEVPPVTMRATALSLNIAVASLASVRYLRAGCFQQRLFLWLVAGSVPCAWIGGALQLPHTLYRPLLGAVLLFAAVRLLWPHHPAIQSSHTAAVPWYAILPIGALIGLLSGLTGTGGGIFLSPLVLLLGWSTPRASSGLSASFILVNSISGLAGNLTLLQRLPPEIMLYLPAVLAGGLVGTWLGLHRLTGDWLLKVLAMVLIIAGGKLLLL
ncbi:MAG: sulfite exporter TauE/SafE family protein [Magnetococcales bacterium]|nr:sulfite exporter TauE/SafE family protein [Magnetococcales bacterium]